MKKLKGVDGKLDLAWAKLVKLRAGMKCEVCSKTTPLNSHHIFSRSKKSTRWHVQNGICLCVGCHVFSSKFSAHKTPLEFIDWLYKHKGEDYVMRLRIKAYTPSKMYDFEKTVLLQELEKEIKEFE